MIVRIRYTITDKTLDDKIRKFGLRKTAKEIGYAGSTLSMALKEKTIISETLHNKLKYFFKEIK